MTVDKLNQFTVEQKLETSVDIAVDVGGGDCGRVGDLFSQKVLGDSIPPRGVTRGSGNWYQLVS